MFIQAYFENIKQILIQELDQASNSIKAAVAWFTDEELFYKLIEKAQSGIRIDIIILNDSINNSSNIDYESLELYNCHVWRISESNNNALMHNKFCLIDEHTIITGSYNWSYKARTNHENITVVKENHDLILQFEREFHRIIKYYFPDVNNKEDLDIVIQSKEVVSLTTFSRSLLKVEFELLKIQILGLENELAFLQKSISDFCILYDIKLGPIILELLELKKKIAEKYGAKDPNFIDAKEHLKNFKESYEQSTKKGWKQLSPEESKELKTIFRLATKLCHPDLVNEANKNEAELIFNELKTLSELNDLEGIKNIYTHLKNGAFIEININTECFEIRKLGAEVNRLKIKRDSLEKNLLELRESETYLTIRNISDMEEYFKYMHSKIKSEIEEIDKRHVNEFTSDK